METNYTVVTKSGKTYKWEFTESKDSNDYGNGIYIRIKHPSGDYTFLDCRYAKKYDFYKTCVDYLLKYYGNNFDMLYQ